MRIHLGRYSPVCVEKLAPGLIRLLATGGPSSSRCTVNMHGVTMSVPRHNSSALLHRAVIVRDECECEEKTAELSAEQARETRYRLKLFEEDWNAAGMEAYDREDDEAEDLP
jgi:hypothetical protein